MHYLLKSSLLAFAIMTALISCKNDTDPIIDMDADFQQIAKECGFVLWDKLFNHLSSPWAATNWERNYKNKYVQKNYETNLVFVKFAKK